MMRVCRIWLGNPIHETLMKCWASGEAVAGLPDICTGTLDSIPERQRALVAKLTSTGGQSIPYYLSVIENMGYSGATIDEPEPMTCKR